MCCLKIILVKLQSCLSEESSFLSVWYQMFLSSVSQMPKYQQGCSWYSKRNDLQRRKFCYLERNDWLLLYKWCLLNFFSINSSDVCWDCYLWLRMDYSYCIMGLFYLERKSCRLHVSWDGLCVRILSGNICPNFSKLYLHYKHIHNIFSYMLFT